MLGNLKVVQAFGYGEEAQKRFEEINGRLAGYSLKAVSYTHLISLCVCAVQSVPVRYRTASWSAGWGQSGSESGHRTSGKCRSFRAGFAEKPSRRRTFPWRIVFPYGSPLEFGRGVLGVSETDGTIKCRFWLWDVYKRQVRDWKKNMKKKACICVQDSVLDMGTFPWKSRKTFWMGWRQENGSGLSWPTVC